MTYPSLAIIGTAGRKEDQSKLTQGHYRRMVDASITFIEHLKLDPKTLQLVSGGAAWADHLVVTLALMGIVLPEHVTLYLPCDINNQGFVGGSDLAVVKTAMTANYYHKMFSETVGHSTFKDILNLRDQGATLDAGNGNFHARNAMIAKMVSPDGVLLAYTFGSPSYRQEPWVVRHFDATTKADDAGLKDGGTAHCFGLAKCHKWHCRLGPIV